MNKYQCWFCGDGLERTDLSAVMITVENLWNWDAGLKAKNRPCESVYAHSECAKDKIKGATMNLEPEAFDEAILPRSGKMWEVGCRCCR